MNRVLTAEFGLTQILLVALVAAIFFGGKKIGDLGKGLGDGIRNFKTALKEDAKDDKPQKEPGKLEAKKE
jgi:sec-independent protein translocase protein TatA